MCIGDGRVVATGSADAAVESRVRWAHSSPVARGLITHCGIITIFLASDPLLGDGAVSGIGVAAPSMCATREALSSAGVDHDRDQTPSGVGRTVLAAPRLSGIAQLVECNRGWDGDVKLSMYCARSEFGVRPPW
jgi:hypothetical protein